MSFSAMAASSVCAELPCSALHYFAAQTTSPSTTATNVVAISRARSVNRQRIQEAPPTIAVESIRNQTGTKYSAERMLVPASYGGLYLKPQKAYFASSIEGV